MRPHENNITDLPLWDDDIALQQVLSLIWQDEGHVTQNAKWSRLSGGRSNPVWHVVLDEMPYDLVCKLFDGTAATPLFANEGTREALVLKHLEGEEVAPTLVAFLDSALGASVLYQHLDGVPWTGAVEDVARLMARLHGIEAPSGLPEMMTSPVSLIAETRAMSHAAGVSLTAPPEVNGTLPNPTRRFLHGDIVPGNIVVTADGLRLIDWQCPVVGDPAADIAIFLSPAMQVLYGSKPLTDNQISNFLDAYLASGGDAVGVVRYEALAPLFHWRMACYCDWKAAHGDVAYRDVAALERHALEQG
ncbi:aminoglycoside phosphotransferase family protein [Aliiroseovarius sp. F20344]|uniref:phosphotransferase family protein n=1 Tax=Aliiroseovarius sp. F20344 TaxID=2926414 RepID=UPI001FF2ADE1|nr:aminoglycoside phosphotransferase family protein [Aliiroseovarius sp. F20344]MCK0141204.1 aminoglycoside phosphotransferase family protein [Aliiroseovarius sp. F20344]